MITRKGGGGAGLQNNSRGWGQVKFYPYKRGGESHDEGGHNKFWGSFSTDAGGGGGAKKGDAERFTLFLGGGAQTVPDLPFSHFIAPPPSCN